MMQFEIAHFPYGEDENLLEMVGRLCKNSNRISLVKAVY